MSVTGSIIAGVGAAGAVGGAAISANAAGNAASTQAYAAEQGAQLQYDLGEQNLGLQTQIFNTEQANEKPFLEAGQNAVTSINDLMGQPSLSSAPAANQAPITAPTMANPFAPNSSAVPITPTQGRPMPQNTTALAKGGPVMPLYMQAKRYLVGEKGPELLTMFPDGHGWVTPHKDLPNYLRAVSHRATGGGVGVPARGPMIAPGTEGVVNPGGPQIHPTGAPVSSSVPAAPATQQSPWANDPNVGADQNNPLVSGGSATPSQNNPFTSWTQQFQAPTAAQAAATPGEQFEMQQGDQALLNQASAAGTTGSSGTAAALDQYNQNLASTYYQQAYSNALGQYQQNYNIFQNNQANQWNRLAATAGIGGVSAGQLNSAGATYGANAGNTLNSTGYNIGNELNNAAAAEASGYVGEANAASSGLSSLANSATLPLYLQMLQQQGSNPGAGAAYNPDSYGLANS